MPGGALDGRCVVIVGASAGVGAATARAASAAGATVITGARSIAQLEALAAQAPEPGRIVAVARDVTDQASVDAFAAAVDAAAPEGIDALLVTVGVTHLAPMRDLEPEALRRILDTNLVGPHAVVRALVPSLAPDGRVGCCSSNAVGAPMPGLGAYLASKAGLDLALDLWRLDHPELALTRIVVGPTVTEAAAAWDPELSAAYFDRWFGEGYFDGVTPVEAEVVADALVGWLAAAEVPVELDLFARLNVTS